MLPLQNLWCCEQQRASADCRTPRSYLSLFLTGWRRATTPGCQLIILSRSVIWRQAIGRWGGIMWLITPANNLQPQHKLEDCCFHSYSTTHERREIPRPTINPLSPRVRDSPHPGLITSAMSRLVWRFFDLRGQGSEFQQHNSTELRWKVMWPEGTHAPSV